METTALQDCCPDGAGVGGGNGVDRAERRLQLSPAVATVGARCMALLIDLLLLAGLGALSLVTVMLAAGEFFLHSLRGLAALAGVALVFFPFGLIVFSAAYFVVLHSYGGQTLGKIFMAIAVVPEEGQPLSMATSFLRLVGYLLSALPLGAGFFWAVLDKDRAAWHDRLAGTRVIAW
ncbi:MAG: RDD family protein [Thermodesulfobacteriota bacterium]